MATVDDATELVTNSMARVENNITSLLNVPGLEGLDKVSVGLRPYLIPDYTGAQTYIMSDGTILDSHINGNVAGASGIATGLSTTKTPEPRYIMPDMTQPVVVPTSNDHVINIGQVVTNYSISGATNTDDIMSILEKNAKPIANAVCEEIMHHNYL